MRKMLVLCCIVVAVYNLVSCENIFSYSLASWAARTEYKDLSELSYSEASSLLNTALANNNAELARALIPVFAKFVQDTPAADPTYSTEGKDLFDALFLGSNLAKAYNLLAMSLLSITDPGEDFLTEIAEDISNLIVWDDTYSEAMMLCLDPELFSVLDFNALALAAFALVLDVGKDLNLNTLDPGSITEQEDIDLLLDSQQFQVVLEIIEVLKSADSGSAPFIEMFNDLFDEISNLNP